MKITLLQKKELEKIISDLGLTKAFIDTLLHDSGLQSLEDLEQGSDFAKFREHLKYAPVKLTEEVS